MEIYISYENLNLVILMIGIAAVMQFIIIKKSEKRAIKFSNYELFKKIITKPTSKEVLPSVLKILVFLCILLAMTDITIKFVDYKPQKDFAIALDTSPSMLSTDIHPTRLSAAKNIIRNIILKLPKTARISLIEFSSTSNVAMHMTSDKSVLLDALDAITMSRVAGTAIGDALLIAGHEITSSTKNGAIILITDGTSNTGIPINESLKYLKKNNITVYAIGIGNETLKFNLTLPEEYRNYTVSIMEYHGVNETLLKFIASETNGLYFRVTNETEFYDTLENIMIKKDVIEIRPIFHLLVLAIVLLLIQWGLEATGYKVLPG